MSNYCSHCGKKLSGLESFCPNCGSKLDKNGSTISTEDIEELKKAVEPLFNSLDEVYKNTLSTLSTNDNKMHSIESVEEAEDDKALNKSISQTKKNVNSKRRRRSNNGIIFGKAFIIIGVILIVGAIIAIIC